MPNRAFPDVELGRRRGGPQPASFTKVGIDSISSAEFSNLIDSQFGTARDSQRLLNAEEFRQRGKLGHPGQNEATISARGASAANILLKNDHFARERVLFDSNGSPKSNEAAAHDRDVRFDFSPQRWRLRRVAGDFLQPERTMRRHAGRLHSSLHGVALADPVGGKVCGENEHAQVAEPHVSESGECGANVGALFERAAAAINHQIRGAR